MKPVFTLRSQLMRPKDALGELKQSGVVYSIPCKDCDVEYIGETGRAFGTSALTTDFHILVSRGGGWLGISRTIKF